MPYDTLSNDKRFRKNTIQIVEEHMAIDQFELVSSFQPAGDQPAAIEALTRGVVEGQSFQTLMGVTGSGKTFTMANVIARVNKPTLILSHNKTLAAQLFGEFKQFFPNNAVHYFVSYYDYYQPEAYIPQRDIYIEKDASINEEIDRLRLAATSALVSRKDVIVVASVSCIYGLGSPEDYQKMMVSLRVGETIDRDEMLLKLVNVLYERSDLDLTRGKFRARGDSVECWPAYEEFGYRIEFWGDEVEQLSVIDPTSGEIIDQLKEVFIYPAKHFVMPEERLEASVDAIQEELEQRLEWFRNQGKLLEAQRLGARTRFDIEMLKEVGHCPGIENYSRHLSGREAGQTPYTLYDFFPQDLLLFVDESHVTLPQLRGMYAGDHSRKTTLVEHGFRLPSALDNRPLQFEEWESRVNQVVFVSATPSSFELEKSYGEVVEQIIRPTGLVDPVIHVRPANGQVPHLLEQIRQRSAENERVLVTTLTKRLAEDLSFYLQEQEVRCKWLHSELDAFERVEILRELREGKFEAVVGVNLLREGLDLPEVSLVAIMDADKEGFLRSDTSLIQTIGRTARNVHAEVILYADRVTDSMKRAIDETERRRSMQMAYNQENGIQPETIKKAIRVGIEEEAAAYRYSNKVVGRDKEDQIVPAEYLNEREKEMYAAAENLEFEQAAALRDQIEKIRDPNAHKMQKESPMPDGQSSGSKSQVRKRAGKKRSRQQRVPRPKRMDH